MQLKTFNHVIVVFVDNYDKDKTTELHFSFLNYYTFCNPCLSQP